MVDFARVEKLDEVPRTRLQKLKERRLQIKQYIKKLGIEIKIPNMKQFHDDAGSHEYFLLGISVDRLLSFGTTESGRFRFNSNTVWEKGMGGYLWIKLEISALKVSFDASVLYRATCKASTRSWYTLLESIHQAFKFFERAKIFMKHSKLFLFEEYKGASRSYPSGCLTPFLF